MILFEDLIEIAAFILMGKHKMYNEVTWEAAADSLLFLEAAAAPPLALLVFNERFGISEKSSAIQQIKKLVY